MSDAAADSDYPNREPRPFDRLRVVPSNVEGRTANREPVTVAVDILDEDHSLRLAMRRLATDATLRRSLGAAGRHFWQREHSMPRMVEDYERVIAEAVATPAQDVTLPSHLVNDGDRLLNDTLAQFSLGSVWE